MARKIFVSYKHSDNDVAPLNGTGRSTARDYVCQLINLFEGDEIYKGEGEEDLGQFKDETIGTHLKDKIYDSSITLVLISPNMKEWFKEESDQWIPWEISYSLKEITRDERTSHTNAILAVVLPDFNSSYGYYLEEDSCTHCHCETIHTNTLFQILKDNMFNIKNPDFSECNKHQPRTVYVGESCYIHSVKWNDFEMDKEKYLGKAESIRDAIDDYDIIKVVTN